MQDLKLRPASRDDVVVIMAIERAPGYEELVGNFSAEKHLANMEDPSYRHLLLCDGADEVVGFVVLTGYGHPWGVVSIHRIAVAPTARGIGTRFTQMVCDHVFAEDDIYRIVLDVLPDNMPAKRAYARTGFVEEGIMRKALRYPDGRRCDLLLMSLLRPEWEEARQKAG